MSAFFYVAQRSLIAGHAIGETYSLDLRMVSIDPPRPRNVVMNKSLGGVMETIFYNSERAWNFVSGPVSVDRMNDCYEFLDSVESGESFTFDPYGTSGSPHSQRTGVRTDTGYSPSRVVRRGGGGLNDMFQISFSVLEQ